MRGWHWFFFGTFSVIVMTLMLPALFGLQNFTQWGGMYSNAWCTARVFDANPYSANAVYLSEFQTAGTTDGTRIVWYGNQHNEETCAYWAKTRCGRTAANGFVIRWVIPVFKEREYLGRLNACDLPPHSFQWFSYDS